MVEAIKHLLGCCGEGHPSLLYLLSVTPVLVMRGYFLRSFSFIRLSLKNGLKRLNKHRH